MINRTNKDKKIAVVGIGGVGGFLGGMLAHTYPHVTFVARGKKRKIIEEQGLVLHSETNGEITVHPEHLVEDVSCLEPQDYIFVCVKNYSLEEVCRRMSHCVTHETVVIPVMNGVDPGDRVRAILPLGTVLDSLIYIVSFANQDGSITQHGTIPQVKVGTKLSDTSAARKAVEVAALLREAHVQTEASENITYEIWKKYMLNCAYNVATAYYDNTIGQLREDPKKAWEYETLAKEAWTVAKASGIPVCQEDLDAIIRQFYSITGTATSSLQRDVEDNRPCELETFSGYLVREAKRLHIPVPVSERMYQGLKEKLTILQE
jgi:2-dehydropantoate 2-reductase